MKKIFVLMLVLSLSLLVFACKKAPEVPEKPVELPPTPTQPPVQPPVEEEEEEEVIPPAEQVIGEVKPGTEKVWGEVEIPKAPKIGEAFCDLANNKITFTFQNNGDYDWSLDQDLSFPPPSGLREIRVFVNGYEANNEMKLFHPDTGEPMFGPNEKFSDNCGGVKILKPGEVVTCTLTGVKLNRGTGSEGLKKVNEVWIDSPAVDDTYIWFKCE